MSAALTLILLEDIPLPGGYRQLTFRSENALSPEPAPGHYLHAAPGGLPRHAPVMLMPAPDRLQILACTQIPIAPALRIQNARIEGDAPTPDPARPRIALVCADGAVACSIFAASRLRKRYDLSVFAHFEGAPPFQPAPSQILMPSSPPGAIAAVPLLDSWDIPSRLSSAQERSGFHHGGILGLLEHWWERLDGNERGELQVLGFGDGLFLHGLKEWCQARAIPLRTAKIPSQI